MNDSVNPILAGAKSLCRNIACSVTVVGGDGSMLSQCKGDVRDEFLKHYWIG